MDGHAMASATCRHSDVFGPRGTGGSTFLS
jgi:hypothetical protein